MFMFLIFDTLSFNPENGFFASFIVLTTMWGARVDYRIAELQKNYQYFYIHVWLSLGGLFMDVLEVNKLIKTYT